VKSPPVSASGLASLFAVWLLLLRAKRGQFRYSAASLSRPAAFPPTYSIWKQRQTWNISTHKSSSGWAISISGHSASCWGFDFIRHKGVIHSDLAVHQFLLDHQQYPKISDFGGSSLKGSDAFGTENLTHLLHRDRQNLVSVFVSLFASIW